MLSSYLGKRVKEYDFSQIDKCWNDTLRFFFVARFGGSSICDRYKEGQLACCQAYCYVQHLFQRS